MTTVIDTSPVGLIPKPDVGLPVQPKSLSSPATKGATTLVTPTPDISGSHTPRDDALPNPSTHAHTGSHESISTWSERQWVSSAYHPSVYVFIFVNPKSGNQVGRQLTDLPYQHFRLKSNHNVQIQWYNLFDEPEKQKGISYLLWLQKAQARVDKLRSAASPPSHSTHPSRTNRPTSQDTCLRPIEIHIWSAGGDGTVMTVYDHLHQAGIDFSKVYFSCIPFGTGNDFSQALGWGKTVESNFVGNHLISLCKITEARLDGDMALLDIWDIEIETFEGGFIQKAQKKAEPGPKLDKLATRMCSYFAMGVQGYVGAGFEANRKRTRTHNFFQYFVESLKWVVFRKFPSVTEILKSITRDGQEILVTREPTEPKKNLSEKTTAATADSPKEGPDTPATLVIHPVEIVIQNIPHIWGREIDLWGEAAQRPGVVENRQGFTDPTHWQEQLSGDGKLEIFGFKDVLAYVHQLLHPSGQLARLGQIEDHFELNFRHPPSTSGTEQGSGTGWFRNLRRESNVLGETCIFVDGEFYRLYMPKVIRFRKKESLRAIGSSAQTSRLVRDATKLPSAPPPPVQLRGSIGSPPPSAHL
ncbi:ATP-NAD kinase-like domain-containing protein [Dimargaris cristalligena]|uniref:diacylglycerol kinase (ATP) n=1 Tax=Dimargaris cristalligena TaxID=215637 RepID=A0A4P9ZWE9_9FUNG|nr:ATP-NAD kinase-like domain-containing protein [Dimargaris cristalligena]|eukprot:RKP37933.1 ATP-NAD kinase-like domain-containing protein [Dimargaris cristalligena]